MLVGGSPGEALAWAKGISIVFRDRRAVASEGFGGSSSTKCWFRGGGGTLVPTQRGTKLCPLSSRVVLVCCFQKNSLVRR